MTGSGTGNSATTRTRTDATARVAHTTIAGLAPWHLRRARTILRRGGLLAYPTEAVYGIGCDPLNMAALQRLLRLKGRPPEKGLILIAADLEQLESFLLPLDTALRARVRATWPGPVTWLLPARTWVPRLLRGAHDSLAVRVTGHPVAAALCATAGSPLVSTSANRAGRPPARSALAVRRGLGGEIDYVVPGAVGDRRRPSEIRDAATGRVLRAG